MQELTTQNWVIPLAIGALVIISLVIAWIYLRNRRTERLKNRFGSEYQHTVREFGSRQKAETDLDRRERHLQELKIRPLTEAERQRFREEWEHVQARFVDDPKLAVMEADRLITEVLRLRGYPVDDFDERVDDVSAAYPNVVSNYREACAIVSRTDRGDVSTEDYRRAIVLYRNLADELFNEDIGHEKFRRVS
jgi:hypothetical protein